MSDKVAEPDLSVWELYLPGNSVGAVTIARSHADAKLVTAEKYGPLWLVAAVSRITACTHPMCRRVVVIGGKA